VHLGGDSVAQLSPTAAWFAHSCEDLEIADEVLLNLRAIVPESVVNPLAKQLNRRLRPELVFARHVKIINEANSLDLRVLRLKLVLNSLIKVALDNILATLGRGSCREVDCEVQFHCLQFGEERLLNQNCFTDTRLSNEENLRTSIEESLRNVSISRPIHRLNVNLVELFVSEWLRLEFVFPLGPVFLVGRNVVLENGVGSWEHWLDISQNDVQFTARSLIYCRTNRPDDRENEPLFDVKIPVILRHFTSLVHACKRVEEFAAVFDTGTF